MARRSELPVLLGTAMREKLELPQNIQKGDHWDDMPFFELHRCAGAEMHELWRAIRTGDVDEIRREAADVANFLAMIVSKCESMGA